MDKSFLVFILIGIGFLYFITNFVGDIQEDDEKYRNNSYNQEHRYDKYNGVDSIGRDVLNLSAASPETQVAAWNESKLKDEYASLFPDFEEMKKFISERVNGEALRLKLISQTKMVEDKFFAGTMTAAQARQEISSLK